MENSREFAFISSTNSPRVNGKLKLKSNSMIQLQYLRVDPPLAINASASGDEQTVSMVTHTQPLSFCRTLSSAGLPSTHDDPSYFAAQSRLYNRISNTKVDLSVILGERQQTINLIATNMKRIASLYRSLKRGVNPFRGYRRSRKQDASKLWLEYAYGWTPLVSDVYALCQLQDHAPPPLHLWGKGAQTLVVDRSTEADDHSVSGFPCTIRVTNHHTKILTTKADAWISVPVSSLKFAQEIGLTNPAMTAWELLPYSFVVDWFLPVGTWLENQNALYGVVVRDACTTRKAVDSVITSAGFYNPKDMPSHSCSGNGQGTYKQTHKERYTGIIPYPPLKFKSPITTSHCANALALLISTFKLK